MFQKINASSCFATKDFRKCIAVQHIAVQHHFSNLTLCLFWWLPLIRTKSNSSASDMEIPRKDYLQSSTLFLTVRGGKGSEEQSFLCSQRVWNDILVLRCICLDRVDRHPDILCGDQTEGLAYDLIWHHHTPLGHITRKHTGRCARDKPSHYEWVVSAV